MKQLFEIQGPVNVTGWQSARSCRQRKLHMLTWPALLLQPPPLRIFTMTPNCPPTHTHFPWSLRGTNWHIYMLMFPIGYTSSSPFFFFFLSPLSSISHSICTPSFFRSSSFLPPPSPSSLTHPQLLPSGMYLARRLETYHPPSFPPPPPPTLLITQWITRFWGGWPPLRKQVSNEYRPP